MKHRTEKSAKWQKRSKIKLLIAKKEIHRSTNETFKIIYDRLNQLETKNNQIVKNQDNL
jgi:hypothetical protein